MKKILSLLLFIVSFGVYASNFSQVYGLDNNGYYIVECKSIKNNNSCRVREHSIDESCVLRSKVYEYSNENVTHSKKEFTWTITKSTKNERCEIDSTTLITGSAFIVKTRVVKGKQQCKNFDQREIAFPRLKIGQNPILSTKGCSKLVILY